MTSFDVFNHDDWTKLFIEGLDQHWQLGHDVGYKEGYDAGYKQASADNAISHQDVAALAKKYEEKHNEVA